MPRRRSIAFLADNNVEESVVAFLRKRGHDVVCVREIMPDASKDHVVAEAAQRSGRMLLTWDKDFTHQRFLQPRFRTLSRIGFSCGHLAAVARLRDVITLVESEHKRAAGGSVVIKIGSDKIQIGR